MKVYCRHKIHQPQKKTGGGGGGGETGDGKKKKKHKNKNKKTAKEYLRKQEKNVQYFHQIIMKNFIYLCTEYIVAYVMLNANSLSVSCPF